MDARVSVNLPTEAYAMARLLRVNFQTALENTRSLQTIRRLAVKAKHVSLRIDYSCRSNNITPINLTKTHSSDRRTFSVSSSNANWSSTKAKVDSNNVLSSPYENVENFTGIHLHDLVWQNLDRWPDKTAVVCAETGRSYTYVQLRKLSGRLATSLRKGNLRPGDTIAVVLPNIPEFGILMLAASEAGLRFTPISSAYTEHEIRRQLKISCPAAMVTVPSRYSAVTASVTDNAAMRLPIIVIEDGSGSVPDGAIKFDTLVRDDVEEFEKTGETTGVDPEDTFIMPHSSGSSGLPKIVELSHRNIVVNIKQGQAKGVSMGMEATASHQEILPLILPMYHIYGLTVCLSLYLCIGGKLICMPQFTPDHMFHMLEDNRVTTFYVAPPLIQLMANDPRLKKAHLESIRTVISGAAPLGEEVLAKFRNKASADLKLVQGYGLTECSPIVALSASAPCTSNGHVVSNTEVRIVGYDTANAGKNLSSNEVGEIHVRGPQVMKGYYKNPEATASCMDGDWLKTGDLGCYDENGLVYIRGRLKELIKVQGYQVAPAEIEDTIQGHEKVLDAAVIGVPHEKYGEVPKAFVVAKSGCKLEPDEIEAWVARRLAKHKRLGYVQFVEKIPKSAAGKILRRELENM